MRRYRNKWKNSDVNKSSIQATLRCLRSRSSVKIRKVVRIAQKPNNTLRVNGTTTTVSVLVGSK